MGLFTVCFIQCHDNTRQAQGTESQTVSFEETLFIQSWVTEKKRMVTVTGCVFLLKKNEKSVYQSCSCSIISY